MDCITPKPEEWPEVSEELFKEYLLQANDYRRDAYSNQINYYSIFDRKVFAITKDGKIFMCPTCF